MIWFTADTHYNHKNIIKYCNRPFNSVEHMNETMITRWNSVVNITDVVYHLGDFTLAGPDVFAKIIDRLNGRIYIIPGGHDRRWLKCDLRTISPNVSRRVEILPPLYILKTGGYIFTLCHYAMRSWPRSHYGSFHLYGHSHCNLKSYGRSLDVGVDCWDFYPINIRTIISILEKRLTPGEIN